MSMQTRAEVVAETLKAAPPVAVAGLSVMGVPLSDIVLIATLVYLALQIGYLVHRWGRLLLTGRPATKSLEDE
jgi:hypothetical protein